MLFFGVCFFLYFIKLSAGKKLTSFTYCCANVLQCQPYILNVVNVILCRL